MPTIQQDLDVSGKWHIFVIKNRLLNYLMLFHHGNL